MVEFLLWVLSGTSLPVQYHVVSVWVERIYQLSTLVSSTMLRCLGLIPKPLQYQSVFTIP